MNESRVHSIPLTSGSTTTVRAERESKESPIRIQWTQLLERSLQNLTAKSVLKCRSFTWKAQRQLQKKRSYSKHSSAKCMLKSGSWCRKIYMSPRTYEYEMRVWGGGGGGMLTPERREVPKTVTTQAQW